MNRTKLGPRGGALFWVVAAVACSTFVTPNLSAQRGLALQTVDALQPILGQVQNVLTAINLLDVASGNRQRAIDHLIEIRTRTGEVIAANQRILDGMRGLRIEMRQEIERAFQEDILKELGAEYADYRVLVADHDPPSGTPYLAEKAYRLDLLAERIVSYDAAVFPVYCAAVALQFAVHALAQTDREVLASKAKRHRDFLDRWLDGGRGGSPVHIRDDLRRKIEMLEHLKEPRFLKIGEVARNKGASIRVDDMMIEIERRPQSGVSLLQYPRPMSLYQAGEVPPQYAVGEGSVRYFGSHVPSNIQSYFPCMRGGKDSYADIPEAAAPSLISQDVESKRLCLYAFISENIPRESNDRSLLERQEQFIAMMSSLRDTLDRLSNSSGTVPPAVPGLRK